MKLIELYLRLNWTLSWFFCNQTVGVAVKCVHKFFDMPPFKWWHLIIFLLNMGHPYNLFLVKMMWEKWFSVVPVARSSQGQFLPGSLPLGLLILGEASHHVIRTLMLYRKEVHTWKTEASHQPGPTSNRAVSHPDIRSSSPSQATAVHTTFFVVVQLGLHCCTWAFPSCSKGGLISSCSTKASHRGGFSYTEHRL